MTRDSTTTSSPKPLYYFAIGAMMNPISLKGRGLHFDKSFPGKVVDHKINFFGPNGFAEAVPMLNDATPESSSCNSDNSSNDGTGGKTMCLHGVIHHVTTMASAGNRFRSLLICHPTNKTIFTAIPVTTCKS